MDIENKFPVYSKCNSNERALIERAVNTLYGNIINKPSGEEIFVFKNRKAISPSPRTYQGVWNWDSAFHTLAMSYFDIEIAHDQMKILFDFQKPDGQIADVVYTNGKTVFRFTKPPVLAWSIMKSDLIYPDLSFLEYAYPHLKSNLSWWETNRFDGTLFSYKVSKMESGWDNTVRFDFPHLIQNCYAVDCNCFMADFYRAMAYIADKLKKPEEAALYTKKREKLIYKINSILFSEKDKSYCDYNFKLKRFTHRLSPASFMPLFCLAADKEKAQCMIEKAKDPNYFHPGIPTISYNNKRYNSSKYWRGPCWLNTAYFTIQGIRNYGDFALADELTENVLNFCSQNKDSIYEYYDSKSGKGLGAKDFGWSSAFILELIKEKYNANQQLK